MSRVRDPYAWFCERTRGSATLQLDGTSFPSVVIRSSLRTENLSTVNQSLLLLRTRHLLPPTTVSHKPRSRIKSGMTELGDWHNVTSCHSELVSESRRFFRVTRMLSLRERKTTQQSTSFFLLFQPPNCYHRPRFLVSPDPGSSPG